MGEDAGRLLNLISPPQNAGEMSMNIDEIVDKISTKCSEISEASKNIKGMTPGR